MRPRLVVVVAAVAVVFALIIGTILASGDNSSPRGSHPPQGTGTTLPGTGTTQPGTDATPQGTKKIIRGLVDRQGEPERKMLPYVHAYVVKVDWAELQPTLGGPISNGNAIDKAIARVREPDFKKLGMALKLRVFTGVGAPGWAKALGGSPIAYKNNQAGSSSDGGTIGRFWSAEYVRAYAELQQALAAKYDNVPEIREITVSGCSTVYDEPFVRQVGSERNVKGLQAAGYTEAADKSCIASAIKAHAAWMHTTSDLDFSPYPDITRPAAERDLSFTLSMMKLCRTELGVRCGLQNNALSTEKLANSQFTTMYEQMTALGSPIIYQTAAKSRLGDPQQVLDAAARMKANSVELPKGYPRWPTTMLADAASQLLANPAR